MELNRHRFRRDVTEYLKENDLSLNELCKLAGVAQPLVWRAMAGHTKNLTQTCRKLCSYLKKDENNYTVFPDPAKNQELMGALGRVWDGSEGHARALSRFIRLLPRCAGERD